ncbi:MAG TPA: hypothetical protein VGF67_02510 [Ktedonobacteraceae bacterium]|jgi:hypothetical protein
MTPETFVQHLPEIPLWLEVRASEGTSKLVLSGEETQVTQKIRQYIKDNREALIDYLAAHPMLKSATSMCFARQSPIEQASSRRTDDGISFCQACWDSRNVTPNTLDLPARVAAWQAQSCPDCGGYDWVVDDVAPPEGFPKIPFHLVCPCRLERTQATRRAAAIHHREQAREARRKQQEQEEAERKRNQFTVIPGKRQIA